MAEWLTQSALRVQTCIAMSTLPRARCHGFDSRGRLLRGRFLWFPFFWGECRSRYQAIAYRSLLKRAQHRPVGPSRRARGREIKKKYVVLGVAAATALVIYSSGSQTGVRDEFFYRRRRETKVDGGGELQCGWVEKGEQSDLEGKRSCPSMRTCDEVLRGHQP